HNHGNTIANGCSLLQRVFSRRLPARKFAIAHDHHALCFSRILSRLHDHPAITLCCRSPLDKRAWRFGFLRLSVFFVSKGAVKRVAVPFPEIFPLAHALFAGASSFRSVM